LPTLIPPTVEESLGPITGLFKFFKCTRGVALYVNGTTVTESRYPWQGDLIEADYVYLGGHTHDISDAEATILTDAGYGEYIS
jgi:hypothetical protein